MCDSDDNLLAISATCAVIACVQPKRKMKCWTRPWLKRRQQTGAYHCLMQELQSEDPAAIKNFLRMEVPQFEELLEKVAPVIRKTDTHLRECISPSERLAITLRYMASGMYATLCFVLHRTLSKHCILFINENEIRS